MTDPSIELPLQKFFLSLLRHILMHKDKLRRKQHLPRVIKDKEMRVSSSHSSISSRHIVGCACKRLVRTGNHLPLGCRTHAQSMWSAPAALGPKSTVIPGAHVPVDFSPHASPQYLTRTFQ